MNCTRCLTPSKSAADDPEGRCLACRNFEAQADARAERVRIE